MVKTQEHALQLLQSWGFPVSSLIQVCSDIEELKERYNELENKRSSIPFDIDGIVYKVNDISLQEALGYTARSPR